MGPPGDTLIPSEGSPRWPDPSPGQTMCPPGPLLPVTLPGAKHPHLGEGHPSTCRHLPGPCREARGVGRRVWVLLLSLPCAQGLASAPHWAHCSHC